MSSIRRILASRANGALSHGPKTADGKARSAHNALRHGLLARQVLLENESKENFQLLFQQHVDRFQPEDGVEIGMIEDMCSAYWRLRRAWAIETRLLDNAVADAPPGTGDLRDRLVAALTNPDSLKALATLHRYEGRLHLMYQRALHNILLLKAVGSESADDADLARPNEPNPNSEHPEVGQAPWPARVPPDPHPALPNEPNPITEHPESALTARNEPNLPPPPPETPQPAARNETNLPSAPPETPQLTERNQTNFAPKPLPPAVARNHPTPLEADDAA